MSNNRKTTFSENNDNEINVYLGHVFWAGCLRFGANTGINVWGVSCNHICRINASSTLRESLRYSVMEGTFVNTDPCLPQKNKMRTCFKWF